MRYPNWWDSTVTIYHRITDKDSNGRTITSWERSVYTGCFYTRRKRQVLHDTAITAADVCIVRIPVPCTLTKGDIVVCGDVPDTIPDNTDGKDLKAIYAGKCFVANTVHVNTHTRRLKHIYGSDEA